MENNLDMGREFNWDDVIQNDGEEFVPLPEGDYDFVVKSFERARHNGSEKIPPCNKAVLKIEVNNGTQKGTITHNLMLHSKCEGLICAFFTGIGHRKHGEQLRMDWNRVAGSHGRCKVGVRAWKGKNGEDMKSNEIKKFYDPAEGASSVQAVQSVQAPQQISFGGGFGSGFGSFGGNR